MKNSNLILGTLLFVFTLGSTFSWANTPKETSDMNVVEIAISDERFSILVDAVVKAGLVDALSADGPYTVFAPTNDAFETLFTTLGVNGIDDLSKDQLTPILLYHVVEGSVMSKDIKSGQVSTLNETASVDVKVTKGSVMVNNSNVIIADIEGSNGVIHVIDAVLVPKTKTAMNTSSGGCSK
ncbi:MAG: fasciclin domain-containing protein [Bacteroidetes bacterium]|nr:fasciclin domain-containing protein [Bacteroidota bacterium]